jgi:hypothetical protein
MSTFQQSSFLKSCSKPEEEIHEELISCPWEVCRFSRVCSVWCAFARLGNQTPSTPTSPSGHLASLIGSLIVRGDREFFFFVSWVFHFLSFIYGILFQDKLPVPGASSYEVNRASFPIQCVFLRRMRKPTAQEATGEDRGAQRGCPTQNWADIMLAKVLPTTLQLRAPDSLRLLSGLASRVCAPVQPLSEGPSSSYIYYLSTCEVFVFDPGLRRSIAKKRHTVNYWPCH